LLIGSKNQKQNINNKNQWNKPKQDILNMETNPNEYLLTCSIPVLLISASIVNPLAEIKVKWNDLSYENIAIMTHNYTMSQNLRKCSRPYYSNVSYPC
jgi:hypothetical protein